MDTAKYHWPILRKLGTDFANRVRSFLVIGPNGEGVIVATEDGMAFWLGKLRFGLSELRTSTEPTPLNIPGIIGMAQCKPHILLLNKRGEIYSMGQNDLGQLGLGTVDQETHFSPQLISIPQHKFISVRCGHRHSLALTEDGKVWAWGSNKYCQVGVPKSTAKMLLSPCQIAELDSHRIVAVECGGKHSLALTDQGEVYGWGWNEWRQLGGGIRSWENSPTRIRTHSPVQSMAAGSSHTLLLTQTGEVWACGDNRCGQLGLPTALKFRARLSKVANLPSISQIASHTNSNLSIAMSSDKRCFFWGEMINEEDKCIKIFKPRELSLDYTTVESPLSFYSRYCSTPHSVSIPETPLNRLSTRMSRMFDNPETSDVQFVVEQRTIHAHRIILSNSSDYFSRMFSERWLVPVVPEDPIVKVTIPDHSYQIFHSFLRFLYTDSFEVYPDLIPEMFELATQYLVPDLQQLCITQMRTTLTPTTCCLYYPLTHRHSLLPELATFQQELVQFASSRMSEVVDSVAIYTMESDLRDQLTKAAQNFCSI